MQVISTTAPGKAVLAGEYAVLHGAPAISAAVNRRARVSLVENANGLHCLEAPGYIKGSWYFRVVDDGRIDWQETLPDPSTFSLAEEIIRSNVTTDSPALTLVTDTQAFYDRNSGDKLGLGSSAAVAVALSAALRAYSRLDDDEGDSARAAHERFQGGRGSGVGRGTQARQC